MTEKTYTMRDVDNRDDAGAPFEFTGTLTQIAEYVDKPLRGDITNPGDVDIDGLVKRLRAGDLPDLDLRELGVYVTEVTP